MSDHLDAIVTASAMLRDAMNLPLPDAGKQGHERPDLSAIWAEDEEGAKTVRAVVGESRAELECCPGRDGDRFLYLDGENRHGGMFLSPDGMRAVVAVLSKWLGECVE